MGERDYVAALRAIASDPAARGLEDDAALIDRFRLTEAPHGLVLTHDMIVDGVHFLSDDPPEDIGWKLVATNVSDLAAKGASPWVALMGATLSHDPRWNRAFLAGVDEALAAFGMALIGGDTVSPARVGGRPGGLAFGLTAIGRAGPVTPDRRGAHPGDALYVTGTIGRAGLGLSALQGRAGHAPERASEMIAAYRRPQPRLAEGRALAPLVSAMMDVSDGLLLDAARMAEASGCALEIDIDHVPVAGERWSAVAAGDDYELLFAADPAIALPIDARCIGTFAAGAGLNLREAGVAVPLPARLGYIHG